MAGINRDGGGYASAEVWRAAGVENPGYEVTQREIVRKALDTAAKAAANAARRLSGWSRSRLGGGGGGGSDGGPRKNTGGDGGSKGGGGGGTQGGSKAKPGDGNNDSKGGNRSSTNGGAAGGAEEGAASDRTHILGIDIYKSAKEIANTSSSLKVLEDYAQEMLSALHKLNAHLDAYKHSPEAAEALTQLATHMGNQFERASLKGPASSHLASLLGITSEAEKAAKLPKRWIDIAYALGIPAGARYIYDRIFRNMDYSPEPMDCPYTGLLSIVPAREHTLMGIENGLTRMIGLLPPRGSCAVVGLLSVLPTNEALEEHGLYAVAPILRRFPEKMPGPVTDSELRFWLLRELDKVKIETPEQAAFIQEQKTLLKIFIGGEAILQAEDIKSAKVNS